MALKREVEVSEGHPLVLPERYIDPVRAVEERTRIGSEARTGLGRTADTYVPVSSNREDSKEKIINPILEEYMGKEGLTIEESPGIVLPKQFSNPQVENKTGDLSGLEREIVEKQRSSSSVVERSSRLSDDLVKVENELREDIAMQKMQVGGNLSTIKAVEKDMDSWSYNCYSTASTATNSVYSLFHHVSKWGNLGYFTEEPITLNETNQRCIDQWKTEISLREEKIKDLEAKLVQVSKQREHLVATGSIRNEASRSSAVEEILDNTREILTTSKEQSASIKALEEKWQNSKTSVNQGFEAFDKQVGYQETVARGLERTALIGLAIGGGLLVTAVTGGAAAGPLMLMWYGTLCGTAASLGYFGGHCLMGGDVKEEAGNLVSNVKDSVLYSASHLVNGAWFAGKAFATSRILGTAAEVTKGQVASSAFRTGLSWLGTGISNLGAGLRGELLPSLADSFFLSDINQLDPIGRLRELNVPEWKIRLKDFTERMGCAGAGGAIGGGFNPLRKWIGIGAISQEGSRLASLAGVCRGVRGVGVSVSSNIVEGGVDVYNGMYAERTWVPWLCGVAGESKDNKQIEQIIVSTFAGTISSKLNDAHAKLANDRTQANLNNQQVKLQAATNAQAARQGISAPKVELSATYLPVALEGDSKKAVATNFGPDTALLERSALMQEHRVLGRVATLTDAAKGGLIGDRVRDVQSSVTRQLADPELESGRSVNLKNNRVEAGKMLNDSLERRMQALTQTDVDDNYVRQVINEGKPYVGFKPTLYQRFLAFCNSISNPYGPLKSADSVIAKEGVENATQPKKGGYWEKFFDKTIIPFGAILEVKLGGFSLFNDAVSMKLYDGKILSVGKSDLISYNKSALNLFGKRFDVSPVEKFAKSSGRAIYGLGNGFYNLSTPHVLPNTFFEVPALKPFKAVVDFAFYGVVQPTIGIFTGAMLLPTPTLYWGPGVPYLAGADLATAFARTSVTKALTFDLLFNKTPWRRFFGAGDGVAAGEMLARKMELEAVRDQYSSRILATPTPVQRENLKMLNREIKRVASLYSMANRVGYLNRFIHAFSENISIDRPVRSIGNLLNLTSASDVIKAKYRGQILPEPIKGNIEETLRDGYATARASRALVDGTVDIVASRVITGLNNPSFLTPAGKKERIRLIADIDLLLGEKSVLDPVVKRPQVEALIINEIDRLASLTTDPTAIRLYATFKRSIQNNTTGVILQKKIDNKKNPLAARTSLTGPREATSDANLKDIQQDENKRKRNAAVDLILTNLEAGTTTPRQAEIDIRAQLHNDLVGKHSMGSQNWTQFKSYIETRARKLSRKQHFGNNHNIVTSEEFNQLIKKVTDGDTSAVRDFNRIFSVHYPVTSNHNFIGDIILGAPGRATGTPFQVVMSDWNISDTPTRLSKITQVENFMATHRNTPGLFSPTVLTKCDTLLRCLGEYKEFIENVNNAGLSNDKIEKLINTSPFYKTAALDPNYQFVVDFALKNKNPVSIIAPIIDRYNVLKLQSKLTAAERAEIVSLEGQVRAIKTDVGDAVFKEMLYGLDHTQRQIIEGVELRTIHSCVLSPLVEIGEVLRLIGKEAKHGSKSVIDTKERKALKKFIDALQPGGLGVDADRLNQIILSKGLDFVEFYQCIGELRNAATRPNAELRLRAALGELGIERGLDARIASLATFPSQNDITTLASRMGVKESDYKKDLSDAYGDRPDLVGTPLNLGRPRAMRTDGAKARILKVAADNSQEKKNQELDDANARILAIDRMHRIK